MHVCHEFNEALLICPARGHQFKEVLVRPRNCAMALMAPVRSHIGGKDFNDAPWHSNGGQELNEAP